MNIAFLVIGFIPLFVLFWVLIIALISISGGWYKLAKAHPYDSLKYPLNRAETCLIGYMQIGFFGRYKMVVYMSITDKGVLFETLFFFRFMHPPFFLEWNAIQNITVKKYFFFMKNYVITTSDAQIVIASESGKKLQEAYLKNKK